MSNADVEPSPFAPEAELPRALLPGGHIAVVAPGGRITPALLTAGAERLRRLGYRVDVPSDIERQERYYAGDPATRAQEIIEACLDPKIDAIWAARGGSGTSHVLQEVEAKLAGRKLPWLIGYSDVTSLHRVWQRAGVQSLHAADLQTLPSWSDAAVEELLGLISGETLGSQLFEGEGHAAASRTVATGRLWGGNLMVLASLCGTGWLPEGGADTILLLEEIGERPYRMDRCLEQLAQSGALVGVRGVALGQLTRCDDPALGYTGLEMLLARLRALDLPLVAGLPLGHAPDSRAVYLGAQASLDAQRGTLVVGA